MIHHDQDEDLVKLLNDSLAFTHREGKGLYLIALTSPHSALLKISASSLEENSNPEVKWP